MLSAKLKRNLEQAIPFGFIWLLFAVVYTLLEKGIMGAAIYYPSTDNMYNFQASLTYVGIGSFIIGLIQGWIEIVWLRKRFEQKPLWVKILLKGSFYLLFIISALIFITIINNSLTHGVGPGNTLVIQNLYNFITTFSFWSIIIYIAVTLTISLFVSEIGEYFGTEMLYNFLLGKYHSPKKEIRIFMFLDMKSSTTIAEKIGHENYFKLLKEYYADMTDAIIETNGEIYQYVGDEIVVSWTEKKGVYQNNCIRCFLKITKTFEDRKAVYLSQFQLVPSFKAGYHIGEVTTGEIGIIKKDIIYTGDVLNTAARIQSKCNTLNSKILLSEELVHKLTPEDNMSYEKIGKISLRGKTEHVQLYSVKV